MQAVQIGPTTRQQLQWKINGVEVPILWAKFRGVIRDAGGKIIRELTDEHFVKDDIDRGLFSIAVTEEDLEIAEDAKSIEVYGQIPRLNEQILLKREIEWQ